LTHVLAADSTLLLYLAATLLMCLSPGPNVLLMISLGLRDGRRAVLPAVGGIVAASLLFLTVSALGVAAALAASATLFAVVRYAGAAYLVYVGVQLVLAGLRLRSAGSAATTVRPAPADDASAPSHRGRFGWQGFVTHLSNPKAVVFWTALLPQFIDPSRAFAPQVVALGGIGIAMDAAVLAGYGFAAAATRHYAPTARFTRGIDVAAGAFFVLTGVLLALAHRN
jgi:homoserine/homoserine lactone efflux protein